MTVIRLASVLVTLAGLLSLSGQTYAQTSPPAPPLKTIGKPSSAKPEVVPSLIVMNARGATLQGDTLTLSGISPNSIVFADRPVRAAGHELTKLLIEDWGLGAPGSASFVAESPQRHRIGIQSGRFHRQGCRCRAEVPETRG